MKRTLNEAAAEILNASRSSSPAQSQQHLDNDSSGLGTGENLGGDTPDTVASHNPDAAKPVGKAKEPGPTPPVGQDKEKGLKSNNGHVPSIDLQSRGTNRTGDQLSHVKTTSTQAEETDAPEGEELEEYIEIAVDEEGNPILDEEGNPIIMNSEDEEDSVILFDREKIYEEFRSQLDEDLGDLLKSDDTLTEDFKKKVQTVFEAAVMARVDTMADILETAFTQTFEEAIESVKSDLTEKVNDYLSYVAEGWMKENEIAIEKSLRTELTEDFISGLKQLFNEHYINIPDDKVDVVQELTSEIEETENKLNEEIQANIELAKVVKSYQAKEIFATVCEGLTDVQKDKMKSLAEGLEFTAEDEFKEKLTLIKENYFTTAGEVKDSKKIDGGLNEEILIDDDKKKATSSSDPSVNAFVHALDRSSSK